MGGTHSVLGKNKMDGETYYQSYENPIALVFNNATKGSREQFLDWMVKKYPEMICMVIRKNTNKCLMERTNDPNCNH
jgi:hypothetical protein